MRHRPFYVAVALGISVVAAVAWMGLRSNDAIGQLDTLPTPTPVSSDSTPEPAPQPVLGYRYVDMPELHGKVLRTIWTSYYYSPDSPDPNNGRVTTIESWLRIAVDGTPTEFAAYSRDDKGTLIQTVYQTGSELVINTPDVRVLPDGTKQCVARTPSTLQSMRANMPAFLQPEDPASTGFTKGGTFLSWSVPAVPLDSTVEPEWSIQTPELPDIWTRQRGDTVETVAIDLATNRMVGWSSLSKSGRIETRMTFGSIEVFPDDLFQSLVPSALGGTC